VPTQVASALRSAPSILRAVRAQGQPITRMTILQGLKPDGDGVRSDGTIVAPAKGTTYRTQVTLRDGGKNWMRGYTGIEALGRTQTWIR
jgi:uncharacterized protein (DUF2147 family)